jgi:hypothetical protein
MPLLMRYTPYTGIGEESDYVPAVYDDRKQILPFETGAAGTKSLKSFQTLRMSLISGKVTGSTTDRKNEMDDSKPLK